MGHDGGTHPALAPWSATPGLHCPVVLLSRFSFRSARRDKEEAECGLGCEEDLESDRAQARDRTAARKRRRAEQIRPDPSGCRAKHAAEPRWVGKALVLDGRALGQGQHDRAINVAGN